MINVLIGNEIRGFWRMHRETANEGKRWHMTRTDQQEDVKGEELIILQREKLQLVNAIDKRTAVFFNLTIRFMVSSVLFYMV